MGQFFLKSLIKFKKILIKDKSLLYIIELRNKTKQKKNLETKSNFNKKEHGLDFKKIDLIIQYY